MLMSYLHKALFVLCLSIALFVGSSTMVPFFFLASLAAYSIQREQESVITDAKPYDVSVKSTGDTILFSFFEVSIHSSKNLLRLMRFNFPHLDMTMNSRKL